MELQEWMRDRRAALGLTLSELSKRCGVSVAQLHNLESGRSKNPRRATMERLMAVLDDKDATVLECAYCGRAEDTGALLVVSPRRNDIAVCRDCVGELVAVVARESRREASQRTGDMRPSG